MSKENVYKNALAADLVRIATAHLDVAARLRGEANPMHINAEFQTLDIMEAEYDRKKEVYREAFAPYGVAQLGETGCMKKQ